MPDPSLLPGDLRVWSNVTDMTDNRHQGHRNRRVEIDQVERVFDDFFKIDVAHLRHERFDGAMSRTKRVLNFERGDAVGVVIVDRDSGRVILVEQFRYPTYEKGPGWMIEVVAGIAEKDETPAEVARREVLEESGYEVDHLHPIAHFYVSPGGSSERIFLFYAEVSDTSKVAAGGGLASEGEDTRIVELPIEDIPEAIESAKILDAKTIIGLMWLHNKRRSEAASAANE